MGGRTLCMNYTKVKIYLFYCCSIFRQRDWYTYSNDTSGYTTYDLNYYGLSHDGIREIVEKRR